MVRSLVLHLPVKLAGWFAHKIKFFSGLGKVCCEKSGDECKLRYHIPLVLALV